ncbi:MAG: hypothetical protein HQK91_10260 [Nitrospirae bacterium]|nr:hypothetical protein [Nitrospirota bacterium]
MFNPKQSVGTARRLLINAKNNLVDGYKLRRVINKKTAIIGRYPLNVQIETVSTCNGKCQFCPYQGSWNQKNPGKMSWETYEKIISDLTNYKIGVFCPYLSNEPLIDVELFDKIEYAVKHLDFNRVEISTNLSLLNSDNLLRMKKLLPTIPHELWISFHGVSRETYEDIMGLSFDKALNNVMSVVELLQDVPLKVVIKGAGLPRDDSKDYKRWFTKEDYHNFWNKQFSKFKKKPQIYYFLYHDRAGSRQLTDKGLNFDFCRKDLKDFYCIRFDKWLHFLYTGELILCCMDYNKETVFDSNINDKTIKEICESPYFIDLIKKGTGMSPSDKDFICKRCISPGG